MATLGWRSLLPVSALLAVLTMLVACDSGSTKPVEEKTEKHIPLPITYAFTDLAGVMLFANEADGMVAVGNRDPGNWRFSGPPSSDRLVACKAGPFRCVRGLSGVEPIVVGDMPVGVPQPFADLGLRVERSSEGEGGCAKFVSTPLPENSAQWMQTVIYCPGIGVAQIRGYKGSATQVGLDLKSAEGLLATGLVFRHSPRP